MAITVTIRSVVDFCRTHVELIPIADVGSISNEPALSLANDVVQELCAQPNAWKFNRVASNLLTTQLARQEQLFAGASAFTTQYGVGIGLASTPAITESSFTVTVNTLQPHNFNVNDTVFMTGNTVAAYNSTYTDGPTLSGWSGGWTILTIPTPTSFTFTHAQSGLANSGAPGILDFAWLESASMYDTRATEPNPKKYDVEAVRTMKRLSSNAYGKPRKAAVLSDGNGSGIITVRFDSVPNEVVWGITLNYQAKPPLKTDLTNTWAPFPDEYGFVYRQAMLARAYRFVGKDTRADQEAQRAEAMIMKAMARDDNEMEDQYVSPEISLMSGGEGGAPW